MPQPTLPLRIWFVAIGLTVAGAAFPAKSSGMGQDPRANIDRALSIVAEMERLLDSIDARLLSARSRGSDAGGELWTDLFDGKSLAGWKVTDFAGAGDVAVDPAFRGGPAAIVVNAGATLSGFNRAGDVPRSRYEVSLEVMKIDGNDFLCGLTFPVEESYASLILGGWGGGVVGISSIDGSDASENETTKYMSFPRDRWFRVRLRVTPQKLQAWLDDKPIVDQNIVNRRISLRPGEISRSIPLGFSTYQTTAAFRAIKLRRL